MKPIALTTNLFFYLCIGLFLISCKSTPEEKPVDTRVAFFELFDNADNLEFNIGTDYNRLLENKSKEGNQYQKATLQVNIGDQQLLSTDIEIRPRGVTRKKLCDYPPLMIKIKRSARDSLDIRKSDNLKIALPCKDDDQYSSWIIKEYLAYKLYSVIADVHYRAKLINLTVHDSLNQTHIDDRDAFMIEPTDVMAQRANCTFDESDQSPVKRIHREQYKNYVLFQYMIGNTDWNLSGRHNIRMLGCDPTQGPTPVPYDFDYSGIVNTEYATPHPMLPIEKVTDRLFQFKGKPEEDFSASVQLFENKKAELYEVINGNAQLSSGIKKEMTVYMDEFYDIISDPANIKAAIVKARKR